MRGDTHQRQWRACFRRRRTAAEPDAIPGTAGASAIQPGARATVHADSDGHEPTGRGPVRQLYPWQAAREIQDSTRTSLAMPKPLAISTPWDIHGVDEDVLVVRRQPVGLDRITQARRRTSYRAARAHEHIRVPRIAPDRQRLVARRGDAGVVTPEQTRALRVGKLRWHWH